MRYSINWLVHPHANEIECEVQLEGHLDIQSFSIYIIDPQSAYNRKYGFNIENFSTPYKSDQVTTIRQRWSLLFAPVLFGSTAFSKSVTLMDDSKDSVLHCLLLLFKELPLSPENQEQIISFVQKAIPPRQQTVESILGLAGKSDTLQNAVKAARYVEQILFKGVLFEIAEQLLKIKLNAAAYTFFKAVVATDKNYAHAQFAAAKLALSPGVYFSGMEQRMAAVKMFCQNAGVDSQQFLSYFDHSRNNVNIQQNKQTVPDTSEASAQQDRKIAELEHSLSLSGTQTYPGVHFFSGAKSGRQGVDFQIPRAAL